MINNIETVVMDLKGLATEKEIKTYISTALVKFHPQPEKLIFDYVITGKGKNKKGLISYTYQTFLPTTNKIHINHPILLFKSILKKDGLYFIIYSNQILEILIENRGTVKAEQRDFRIEYLGNFIDTNGIILSDNKNLPYITALFGDRVIPIEPLYKKCRNSLFIPKKKLLPKIIKGISLLIILSIATTCQILNHNKKLAQKEKLQLIHKKQEENKGQLELENKYNSLLTELYIIGSQIEPDIYSILYDLNKYGNNYKISDFNYSLGSLRLNVITTNSIELLQELNTSPNLELNQNTVTTNNGLEQVNITGNVKLDIGVDPTHISGLEKLISEYSQMFFSKDESSIIITTEIIKNRLLNNSINITQYQSGKESVRYSINGYKSDLLKFFYSLSEEGKIYKFNLISIKMADNSKFSGVLDITRVTLSDIQNSNNYIEKLLIPQTKYAYNSHVLSPLGIGFSESTPIVAKKNVVKQITRVEPNTVLSKFIFLGRLTQGNSNLIVFKESINGRIFKFRIGDIFAGYKYIGEENNKFLFEKNKIRYEVNK